ncbi:hypothetical protein [Mastigocladopsis repens]|uniref:hypothetical protein n=1 Tax=Mastigocladopsis repens TaxID=221287 RepID=UPI0002D313C4|nr:hypothetical protein [Mastigocladopsis repens]
MNFKSSSNKVQPAPQSETTANWLECIVEELSDEAAAAVVGGKKLTTTTTSTSDGTYTKPDTARYTTSPEETLWSLYTVVGG